MSHSVFFPPLASRRRKMSPITWNSRMNQAIHTKKTSIDHKHVEKRVGAAAFVVLLGDDSLRRAFDKPLALPQAGSSCGSGDSRASRRFTGLCYRHCGDLSCPRWPSGTPHPPRLQRTWAGCRADLPDGLGGLLPRGAAGPAGRRRRLLDRRASGHAAAFSRFVGRPATSPSPSARSTPPTIRMPIRTCSCPARSSSACHRPRAAGRRTQLVGVRAGRVLEETRRSRHDAQRPRPPSGHPGCLRGRGGFRRLGGQGASHRGRVGVGRTGRARRRDLCLGRRALPERRAAWPIPGRAGFRGRT